MAKAVKMWMAKNRNLAPFYGISFYKKCMAKRVPKGIKIVRVTVSENLTHAKD